MSIEALSFPHKPELMVSLVKVGKWKVKRQLEISTLVSIYGVCKRKARKLLFLALKTAWFKIKMNQIYLKYLNLYSFGIDVKALKMSEIL